MAEAKTNRGRLTDSDALKRVRGYFEQGLRSSTYQQWQTEAREAWRFYDGEHWTPEERQKLAEYGQAPIVINKLAAKIDNLAGTEVANRTRILFRSRSGDQQEEQTARALSDLALYVAERTDMGHEVSAAFKAGLVTGIGWLDVGVESAPEGVQLFARAEDELSVVWDPNARRDDFADARFVARERWLDEEDLRLLFPKQAEQLLPKLNQRLPMSSGMGASARVLQGGRPGYMDAERGLFRVVEVQYKQTEQRFRVKQPTGEEFLTFNRKFAYADQANTVTSEYAPRVYIAYFSDNVLLSHEALGFEHSEFTLLPYVYKRRREDGRPYGILRGAIDPQRELNKRRSKAMHLLNTAQVIADVDAVDDPNQLAREAARPDGLILKRPGKDLRILRNSDLASSQVAVMEQASRDIQEVLGVYDESLGKQSNATSGIAIQTRQLAGNRNQLFAFDALRKLKKRLGLVMLALVRQFFTSEMVIQITDDLQAPRQVRLNQPVLSSQDGTPAKDDNGKVLRLNDVRQGVFDIHVEEVRDVLSGRELDVAQLNMLIQAGVPIPPQMLVEATNLRNKDEIIGFLTSSNKQGETV